VSPANLYLIKSILKNSIAIIILLLVFKNTSAQQTCPIIPKPLDASKKLGVFLLEQNTPIVLSNAELKPIAAYLQHKISQVSKITLPVKSKNSFHAIQLVLDSTNHMPKEGYTLKIAAQGVLIKAATTDGVFYGVISLLQFIEYAGIVKDVASINCWDITDAPQYKWRGLMLDESRHFMGKEKVKSLLDWMAFYKLNRFHWHLTDEPAWRLEIKRYPQLALIGGIGSTTVKNTPAMYYTQQDIAEVISYATERHITIIPEIDMPGHATAANRAYPEFSGGGSAGHPDFTFNPGNAETYTYLSNILKETIGLFPSHMIHIGGDEVSVGNEKWSADTGIIALMKREHLSRMTDVEHYFIKRMADSVNSMRSKLLVWDEMAGAGLPVDSTLIFWWRQDKPEQLKLALNKGYSTILCPRLPLYFDFVQDSTHQYGRKWNGLYNSLQQVYNFDARSFAKDLQQKALIIGIQANLWTETVDTEQRLDYLLFPRIAALAEAAWTDTGSKNYAAFSANLQKHLLLYSKAGLYFYDPMQPLQNPEPPMKRKKPSNYKD
jgi:hexosaminidase